MKVIDTENEIRSYLLGEFLPNEDPSNLKSDTDLIAGGVLDSIALIKLTRWLEERLSIQIEAHETASENMATVARMATMVARKRG